MAKDNEPVVFKHTDAAAIWANSEERKELFRVNRAEENPDAGKPKPYTGDGDQPEDYTPELEPETVEVVDVYTMPAKPNPGLALDYLRRARREGGDVAMSWLIETAVGSEGYDALIEELATVDPKDAQPILQGLVKQIQVVAMGGLEPPKA